MDIRDVALITEIKPGCQRGGVDMSKKLTNEWHPPESLSHLCYAGSPLRHMGLNRVICQLESQRKRDIVIWATWPLRSRAFV